MYLLSSHCVSVVLICGFLAEPLVSGFQGLVLCVGAGLVWLFRVTFLLATAASQNTGKLPSSYPSASRFCPQRHMIRAAWTALETT